ncbi:MAG: PD40 domain-containing protein, partial [Bacteroidales bacterium]|nr:PD40 domain-containing protein [Bacteroidales bacterium]
MAEGPVLSPDAAYIYFGYCGDIYKVPVAGGNALCVVNAGGFENAPKVSPDGKYLAFASDLQGNKDVYMLTLATGDIKRMTYHQNDDVPTGWSADSKYIFFESARANAAMSTYKVSIEGGTPQRLFNGYFNTISNLVESPTDGKFYFNLSSEAINFPTRKRYVGDHNPEIQSWDPATKSYKQLTNYEGKDVWPMVDSKGKLYFVSDRFNKESNIYLYSEPEPIKLTSFEKSVQYPSISFDGSKIVFLKEYEITVLDLNTLRVDVPQIALPSNNIVVNRSFASQKPTAAAISPDDKKFAFAIRGLLYVSDNKGSYLAKLETPADERVKSVAWGQDSKTIYYTRTNKGWTNLYKIAADGKSAEEKVYTPDCSVVSLTPSHSGKYLAFTSGSRDVMLYNTSDGSVKKVADAEIWGTNPVSMAFSFDDKFLAFDAMNLFEKDIFICDLTAGTVVNLTNSAGTEAAPAFSSDGKYLYFAGNYQSPSFPGGSSGASLYELPLLKYDKPFDSDSYDELFKSKSKQDSSVKIDYKDIYDRISTKAQNASSPYVFKAKAKEYLLYTVRNAGKTAVMVQEISDKKAKAKEIAQFNGGSYFQSKDNLYCFGRGGDLYKVDVAGAKATKIDVSKNVEKNLKDEFSQMFYEVWAVLDQNYYDVKFHGVDWKEMRDYYAQFLPYIHTRKDLRRLVIDMQGELNSSHQGFTSTGPEENTQTKSFTLDPGILFNNEAPYIVERVVKNSTADKVSIDIKRGDELVAVNGVRVDKTANRESYFTATEMLPEISLTFNRDGKEFTQKIHTQTAADAKLLLYAEWEETARQRVEEATSDRVAYIHMRAMGNDDLQNFLTKMHTYALHKDALILDLRFNNGGNVHNQVLNFLRGQEHFRWSYRDFDTVSHPNVAPAGKPIVVLVNERSLSDA